jgi:pimeloyl-ACP methyl ester carboxylesterase
MNIANACSHATRRFHLVGHDWGASIAWGIADRYPDRLASLAVLSRPHPNAFNRALAMADGEQAQRSRHHKTFLEPDAGPRLLADGARVLRDRLTKSGVPAEAIEQHMSVLGNESAIEAALAWYRARGAIRSPLGLIKVPVLYIWGDADDTVGRAAAEGTRDFVCGPYEIEILPGINHFAAEQAPQRVTELLLAHLARYPA